ncbi:MAG: cell division protein FtsZ [Chloroflexota bacterium]
MFSPAKGFTEVKIVGVGGGGGNAVNRMVDASVQGVEFISVNTDAQALAVSSAYRKIIIGAKSTRGLGAGGDPTAGERAAEIDQDELIESLDGADMVFVTAGMGGGTGTGAAPTIAKIARQHIRALTVGIVTLPFRFEGAKRARIAEEGVERLRNEVDALIVIPNDKLLRLGDVRMTVVDAFKMADDVLRQGIQGISDLVTMTGLINLDFADVKSIMADSGPALMAIGEGRGEDRALMAAQAALNSPLLDVSIEGARGVLLNITGGPDLALSEVAEAAEAVREAVDESANIIFGAVVNPHPQADIKITVIATGLKQQSHRMRESPRVDAPARPPRSLGGDPTPADDDFDAPSFLRRRSGSLQDD